jgi:hypothetical protein
MEYRTDDRAFVIFAVLIFGNIEGFQLVAMTSVCPVSCLWILWRPKCSTMITIISVGVLLTDETTKTVETESSFEEHCETSHQRGDKSSEPQQKQDTILLEVSFCTSNMPPVHPICTKANRPGSSTALAVWLIKDRNLHIVRENTDKKLKIQYQWGVTDDGNRHSLVSAKWLNL